MTIITIGSNSSNKIVLTHPHISSSHAELNIETNGSMSLTDISRNGTWVNGRRIHKGQVSLHRGDTVMFANAVKLDWNLVSPVQTDGPNIKHRITVGKNADNTIQIHHQNISRYHAIIKVDKRGRIFVSDQSTNGVFVNGHKIPRTTDFPVKRGDRVSFAQVQDLDWKKIPKAASRRPVAFIVPIAVLLMFLGVLYKDEFRRKLYRETVSKRYENSIGLIYNSYYLAYVDNGDTLYFIGAGNSISPRKEEIQPFEITGSGFYVSNEGEIITNKHVAAPWVSEVSVDKEAMEKAINIARSSVGQYSLSSDVVGVPVRIGIFPNGSTIEKNDFFKNMLPCRLIKVASEKEVDLALIQLESKKIANGCTPVKDIISKREDISEDDEVTVFGYPFGFDLATKNVENKVKASLDHGKVSKISDRFEIQYNAPSFHGASGSPVFNQHGELIAVNYAGIEKAQGYNFGIIATHVSRLLNN
nr:FHA domain-containing protein [uncultured Dyadobacter sp.]